MIICSLKGHSFYNLNEKNDVFDKIKECSLCNLIFAYKKIDTTHANYSIYKFQNNDHLKDVLLEKNEDNMKEYRHGYEFKDGSEFFIENYLKEIVEHIKNKQGSLEEKEG